MIAKRYPVATPFYPLWLSPLPHRVADVALLVHIVFEDSGNLVEAAKRLRLGLGGTTNAEMPRREGVCGPTDAKAPPVSALAIVGDIERVPFAVEDAPGLRVCE
jgi:hypothetical protein